MKNCLNIISIMLVFLVLSPIASATVTTATVASAARAPAILGHAADTNKLSPSTRTINGRSAQVRAGNAEPLNVPTEAASAFPSDYVAINAGGDAANSFGAQGDIISAFGADQYFSGGNIDSFNHRVYRGLS
jgi:hypothetical protein